MNDADDAREEWRIGAAMRRAEIVPAMREWGLKAVGKRGGHSRGDDRGVVKIDVTAWVRVRAGRKETPQKP
ncbi:hypothetical protein N7508_001169 [Penicillium antarcticum]|uniref:uncharacterized protein n=1 Tax=Penicillium antarcticum TaxID=416450 RepID=UPI00239383B6|nr:uncharacterized protein N7508_001169 [Penicillium antarcticum]KAJ5316661.1 hypothetical protein N7508_001169 [Penicillium antarcticum]